MSVTLRGLGWRLCFWWIPGLAGHRWQGSPQRHCAICVANSFRPSATDVHASARSGTLLGEGGSQPWLQVKLMKGDFKKYRCLGAAMDKMNQSSGCCQHRSAWFQAIFMELNLHFCDPPLKAAQTTLGFKQWPLCLVLHSFHTPGLFHFLSTS